MSAPKKPAPKEIEPIDRLLSESIATELEKRSMNQADLLRRLPLCVLESGKTEPAISQSQLSKLLAGKKEFTVQNLEVIAIALGVPGYKLLAMAERRLPSPVSRQAQARAVSTLAANDGGASGLDGVSSDDLLAEIRRRIKDS